MSETEYKAMIFNLIDLVQNESMWEYDDEEECW